MKAAYFMGIPEGKNEGYFEVKEKAVPTAGQGQVVIKNMAAGICGTDVHIFHGEPGSADVNPPVVLGHEYSGEIVEVGAGVEGFEVGDHVTVDPNIYCGHCYYCQTGKKQLCEHMEAIGVTMDGGFEQYSVVPASQAFKLDKNVPWKWGAMTEPTACCLRGIDRAGITTGDSVVIVGGGAIGLIMMQLAKLSGAAKICVSEPNSKRRQSALTLGADAAIDPTQPDYMQQLEKGLGQDGADVVIECVGNPHTEEDAIRFAGKGATVMFFGLSGPDAEITVKPDVIFKKELHITSSFINPYSFERSIAILSSGTLDVKSIITTVLPLEEMTKAFTDPEIRKAGKVMIKMPD